MTADRPAPGVEIMLHSAGDRARVIRLGGIATRVLWASVVLLGLYVAVGLVLTPRLLRGGSSRAGEGEAALIRDRLEERAGRLAERFETLIDETEGLRARLAKAYLAYTLGREAAEAGGGIELAAEATSPDEADESAALLQTRLTNIVASAGRLLDAIETIEADAEADVVAEIPALSPISGPRFVLTSGLGFRVNPVTELEEYHAGIDLAAPEGTPIYAPADGRVVFVGPFLPSRRNSWWRLGRVIGLYGGGRFVTVFGHLGKIFVQRGERVERGALIAEVGDSGWTPSPHLHYGVWRRTPSGFIPVEPRLYMLDQRWPDDDEIVAKAREPVPVGKFDAMPRAFRIR